ncbi:MAG TPA: hypothetical protein PLZ78_15600, partial [Spirochaetota bacterium]|nr:hypothetical protein [Spirochaetota bacterium]
MAALCRLPQRETTKYTTFRLVSIFNSLAKDYGALRFSAPGVLAFPKGFGPEDTGCKKTGVLQISTPCERKHRERPNPCVNGSDRTGNLGFYIKAGYCPISSAFVSRYLALSRTTRDEAASSF